MKVIVSFSGGKDSLASLLWVRNNLTKDFITVFCDTGWEHPLTYKYIEEVQEQLGLNLITVKSKKFNGMVDLTKKKSRWPSSQRRFCTSELKTIPMIDYILDEVNDDVLIIQGIRAAESAKRAEMSKQCTYFKYYVQPYGKDKNGKDKYHTYRRKDVLAFRKKYADDLLRPVFDWSAQQVIDYILENGIQPSLPNGLQTCWLLSLRDGFTTRHLQYQRTRARKDKLHCRSRTTVQQQFFRS